jgi:hypothetical protein
MLTMIYLDTFPDFIVSGKASSDWQYVRETSNHYSQGPVSRFHVSRSGKA